MRTRVPGAAHPRHPPAAAVTDAAGAVIERHDYEPYGSPTLWSASYTIHYPLSTDHCPFLFTGQLYDPETGLYHYKARALDTVRGRFLQRDPKGYAGGPNHYSYLDSHPTTATDPLGLCEPRDAIIATATQAATAACGDGAEYRVEDIDRRRVYKWDFPTLCLVHENYGQSLSLKVATRFGVAAASRLRDYLGYEHYLTKQGKFDWRPLVFRPAYGGLIDFEHAVVTLVDENGCVAVVELDVAVIYYFVGVPSHAKAREAFLQYLREKYPGSSEWWYERQSLEWPEWYNRYNTDLQVFQLGETPLRHSVNEQYYWDTVMKGYFRHHTPKDIGEPPDKGGGVDLREERGLSREAVILNQSAHCAS